ncbi:MAG: pyruvate formate lyase family protein, partial [Spirochaetota bacterium]
ASLSQADKRGRKGAQLKAMLTACRMPKELAEKYAQLVEHLASEETDERRRKELEQMAGNLHRVPWESASTFWEALQSLWLTHMLVMSDENYPGPGLSFGRIDQYLLPYWEKSLSEGMEPEFGQEILKCFWFHVNTATTP